MNLRQQALKGLLWSALEKWGGKFFALLVFLMLARLLEPADFGLVALAGVFISLVQVLVQQGFAAAIIQRDDLQGIHLNTAFWINFGTGLLMMVVSLVAAQPIAHLLREPALEPVIRMLSPVFFLASLNSVQAAILQRDLAFQALAIRTLIANVVGGIVGVGMAFSGFGVWSLVGQQLAGKTTEVIVLWQASPWRPGFRVSMEHFKELFSFSVNIVGMGLLNFVNRRSDDFLIGYFLGSVALGYYTVAYNILTTLMDVLTSVTKQVAFPVFSKLQNEPERLRRAFYTTTRYTAFISFPVLLGLAATAQEAIPVIFGSQWEPSIPVMQLLALAGMFISIVSFNNSVLMAIGKPSWGLLTMTLAAIVNIIAFSIAVRWGIVAVAAAVAIRGYVFFPLLMWIMHKLVGVSYGTYLRQFVVSFFGALVMAAAVTGLRPLVAPSVSDPVFLGLAVGVGAILYFTIVYLFAPAELQDALGVLRSLKPTKKGSSEARRRDVEVKSNGSALRQRPTVPPPHEPVP